MTSDRMPSTGAQRESNGHRFGPRGEQVWRNNMRARAMGARGRIRTRDWRRLLARVGYRCLRCGRHEREVGPLTIDHVMPLAAGGGNTIHDVQPLCSHCNQGKGIACTDYRIPPMHFCN
jgi:5-methylcytosine-specific restriction endonuclease McrA